ncbi:MAG: phosphatidate cytidylyltransferase [Spirochaetes bacterium]|nr:phosphatidate cytidylyltransferase [Spirochaetota bacterium]
MKRLIAAAIFLPLLSLGIFFEPLAPVFFLAMIVASLLAANELFIMAKLTVTERPTYIVVMTVIAAAAVLFIAGWYAFYPEANSQIRYVLMSIMANPIAGMLLREPVFFTGATLIVALFAVNIFRPSYDNAAIMAIMLGVFAFFYAGIFIWHIAGVRMLPHGRYYLGMMFIAIWSADGGAYYLGKRFGQHKMSGSASPNKSIEGTIASFIVGTAVVIGINQLVRLGVFDFAIGECGRVVAMSIPKTVIFSLIFIAAGFIGDMGESVIKRAFAAKDSGNFILGHGGVLDRFDGPIIAAPILYYMVFWHIL